MKKFVFGFISIFMLFSVCFAYEPVITKQVSGKKDLTAKSVVFISGEPIVMEGTATIKSNDKSGSKSKNTSLSLTSDNGDTLSSQINYTIEATEKSNNQIIENWKVSSFSETLKVGSKTYDLTDYEYTRSDVRDQKPIGDYYAGNISFVKTYTSGNEIVKLVGTGTVYGYNNVWAKNETVRMTYVIQNITNSWSGKASVTVSDTDQKKIRYSENYPSEISFAGSYILTENNISTLKYTSEMPEVYGTKVLDYLTKESDSFKYESFPVQTRLPEYYIKGITGHWGEDAIRKAFSLEFMDEWDNTDTPDTGVTRAEFAKVMYLLMRLDVKDYTDNEVQYKDVSVNNPYYKYIRALTEKGVLVGTGNSRFQPNAIISRAEAITMIINAIGFENRAPEAIPILNFNDANEVPKWAIKYIYMANKIGIVNGNEMGEVMPNKQLTKAEIASICNRLITYLTEEMSEEYIK